MQSYGSILSAICLIYSNNCRIFARQTCDYAECATKYDKVMMQKTVYRSRIDWWLIAIVIFTMSILVVAAIGGTVWLSMLYGILMGGLFWVALAGTWYAIEGDRLLVYQFFRPTRLPIAKIKEVRYCRGVLAGPCLSTRRLSIKFTDRSVLKSAMPIEISPRDRDGMVRQLLEINPAIKVIGSDKI